MFPLEDISPDATILPEAVISPVTSIVSEIYILSTPVVVI